MKLNAPKQTTWIIAVIVGILGVLGHEAYLGVATQYAFWLVTIGFALLAIATMVREM